MHRIIPAFAGNTPRRPPSASCTWDHPRFRGEHTYRRFLQSLLSGSSPLSRGTLAQSIRDFLGVGIIPAFAGNTFPCLFPLVRLKDHPRFRGEHSRRSQQIRANRGSSPLSRGTLRLIVQPFHILRIIPAFAGNTLF